MGRARMESEVWDQLVTKTYSGKSSQQIFTSPSMPSSANPAKIDRRESRDSKQNPLSLPIILVTDVTGSMIEVARQLLTSGIPKVVKEIYDRKPGGDPHVMVMAVGDAKCDTSPLQMTQFEADIVLADQVSKLFAEGGGGGNGGESYCLAHYAAARKTVSDSWEKRGRKGFLFTIGDEPCHNGLTADEIKRVFGDQEVKNLTAAECVAMASAYYEVYHIVLVNEGYARGSRQEVVRNWQAILPERVIQLEDMSMLAETIVSTIQIAAGADKQTVVNSWSGNTSVVVANAVKDIAVNRQQTGAVRLAS